MTGLLDSYLSPKVERQPNAAKGGCGIFCRERIVKDEIIVLWGGKILAAGELDPHMPNFTQEVLQIEDDFYIVTPIAEPSDCFNHSCEPNAGMTGQIGMIALRDIEPGEEVCMDYAMCDGSNYDEFECHCGTASCRKRITGEDWKRPELWDRYEGYFSPYLQRRITRLRREVYQVPKTVEAR
jgi:uncharacterized protein